MIWWHEYGITGYAGRAALIGWIGLPWPCFTVSVDGFQNSDILTRKSARGIWVVSAMQRLLPFAVLASADVRQLQFDWSRGFTVSESCSTISSSEFGHAAFRNVNMTHLEGALFTTNTLRGQLFGLLVECLEHSQFKQVHCFFTPVNQ